MKNINANVNSNNETINTNNINNGENNMNEINLKSLHCSDCARAGISCICDKMPAICGKRFIHATSDEMKQYIRFKVVDIMEQLGIEQDKIQAVAKMDIECF